jgi:glycopeptide antibiotics resistance protein
VEQVWRSVRPLLPLIPLGLLAVALAILGLTIVRLRHGVPRSTALSSSVLDVTLTASIVSVLILTLPPSIGSPRTVNIVPFAELRHAVGDYGVSQLAGNAILFVPFGFLAPLRWHRLDSFLPIVVASAAFSVLVELLQFILPTGRQTSVTDVIMNVVGATAGYLAMLALRGLARRVPAATGIP